MWPQNYTPLGSLWLSALVASLPVFVLLFLIGVKRQPALEVGPFRPGRGNCGRAVYVRMPVGCMLNATIYGVAFGMFPIGWIVYWAIVLYKVCEKTGKFEIIKDSVGGLTDDRRLQALLIAFAFGAFIEGAAGFGTPVAVAAAMFTGLGFAPFYAAGICLLANTAPVAFGSIGIPVVTLARITGLNEHELSAWVGRICAPISVFIPAYLIMVMGGIEGPFAECFPPSRSAALRSPRPSISYRISSVRNSPIFWARLRRCWRWLLLLKVWKPSDNFTLADSRPMSAPKKHSLGRSDRRLVAVPVPGVLRSSLRTQPQRDH